MFRSNFKVVFFACFTVLYEVFNIYHDDFFLSYILDGFLWTAILEISFWKDG